MADSDIDTNELLTQLMSWCSRWDPQATIDLLERAAGEIERLQSHLGWERELRQRGFIR